METWVQCRDGHLDCKERHVVWVSSRLILEGQRKEVKEANHINPSSLLEKDL